MREDEIRLLNKEIADARGGIMFHALMEHARESVEKLKKDFRPAECVRFESDTIWFKVSNIEYPAIWVEVRYDTRGVVIEADTAQDATSFKKRSNVDRIEIGVDSSGEPHWAHHGKRLGSLDEVVRIIVAPIFRL